MALLDEAAAKTIAEHVAAAERRTAGEIVVAVARRSDEYGRQRAVFCLLLTLLGALLVYHYLPQVPEPWVLGGQAPLAVGGWWLSGIPTLLRRLVARDAQHAAVRSRAQQLFLELGVTETKQRSGVLLLISEAEHRVELLADRGIHERVGGELWEALVQSVTAALVDGHAAQGICEAVDAVGDALAQHFPRSESDVNELPDAVTRV
jgi:putative membrane protein